mmetsp:Transcript_55770/g.130147  ORF Transcript_55770/g.130147 Transcript_55770/m.130147 type:complete len:299 (+) Transcript_55770:112-1008(+)
MTGLRSRRGLNLNLGTLSLGKMNFSLPGTSFRDYDIKELLGSGAAGKVFRAKQKRDDKEVALKIMQCLDEEMLRVRCGEFNVLRTLRHPHIVNVLSFWTMGNEAVLEMELHSESTLRSVVRKATCIDESTARDLFSMLLEAIDFLHQKRIIHRDIKPENILVREDLSSLWLADFNAAHSLLEGGALSMTYTAEFAAPEALTGQKHEEPADVWSAGMCLYYMLRGDIPRKLAKYAARSAFVEAVLSEPISCEGASWSSSSRECKHVVKESLALNDVDRPSAKTLLSRPWMRQRSDAGGV